MKRAQVPPFSQVKTTLFFLAGLLAVWVSVAIAYAWLRGEMPDDFTDK